MHAQSGPSQMQRPRLLAEYSSRWPSQPAKTSADTQAPSMSYSIGPTTRRPNPRRQDMIKVSVMYPNTPGARFDHEYYRDKHMPLVKKRLGDACLYYTVDKGLAGGAPGAPATYVGMCHIFCDSVESLSGGLRAARKRDHGRHSELHRLDPRHSDKRSGCWKGLIKPHVRAAPSSRCCDILENTADSRRRNGLSSRRGIVTYLAARWTDVPLAASAHRA